MNVPFITELHEHIRKIRSARDVLFVPGKQYPRFEQIVLLKPAPILSPLSELLKKRRSADAMSGAPLPLEKVSTILHESLAIREDNHRPHPSGGARFPIEVYVIPFNVSGLPRFTYHYRPDTHALEILWPMPETAQFSTYCHDTGTCTHASALVLLSAFWERSAMRYSSFAFELALIEAGHIGQNIVLTSGALGIASRPLSSYREDVITKELDLDPTREQPIYAVALGES